MAQRDLAQRARSYSVPAVDPMLDIAEFLVQRSRPFGITELARELGVSTNSVFRILRRLHERGYVEFDEETCIGCPVFDVNARIVGGVEISGLAVRWSERDHRRLAGIVRQAAERICRDIGYDGDFYARV